jgi:curved DNA-binding protein CbpA
MPGLDPYKLLGVSRKATKEKIRAAFRRKAKDAHPDVGGNNEDFERLHLCYRTLMDDAKRARYDDTGEIENPGPDNSTAAVLGLAAAIFEEALGSLPPQAAAECFDMIALMRQKILERLTKITNARAGIANAKAAFEKLRGRFKTVDDVPNQLNQVIEAKLASLTEASTRMDRDEAMTIRAREFLEDYEWVMDKTLFIPAMGGTTENLGSIFGR